MKRPFCVTISLWLVLTLSVWSSFRLAAAIRWWNTLVDLASRPGPLYIAASGVIWLIAGIALLWGIIRRQSWSRLATLSSGITFTIWYWGDAYLFQMPRENWLFSLGASMGILGFIIVCSLLPNVKKYFEDREDHDR